MKRLQGLGFTALILLAAGGPAMAQTPPPSGPGSLDGIWVGGAAPVRASDGKPIPFTASAKAAMAKLAGVRGEACLPAGMPAVMNPPKGLALQFVETPDQKQMTVLFGSFGTFRIIYLDEKHPDDPDPTFMGNSVGHWERGTLIVDTIALTDESRIAGAPHGDQLHLVERIRRTGKDTLEDRITVTDPMAFTRPWTWVVALRRFNGVQVQQAICEKS